MPTDSFRSMAYGSIEPGPFLPKSDEATAKTIAEFHAVTVYVHGATGSFLGYQSFQASRVMLQELRYSGYNRAILVRAVPRGKRNERSYIETTHASTVVVDGWNHPDLPSPFASHGRGRHPAFDEGWDNDFAVWLDALVQSSEAKILADLRGHDPEPAVRTPRPAAECSGATSLSPPEKVENPTAAKCAVTDTPAPLVEGAALEVTLTRYERDPQARALCLAHYGVSCLACGANFEQLYGEVGRGFIHVHHVEPLAVSGDAHVVDPVTDLRPVCPNCHAMLHRKSPPFTVAELQVILKSRAG